MVGAFISVSTFFDAALVRFGAAAFVFAFAVAFGFFFATGLGGTGTRVFTINLPSAVLFDWQM